MTEQQTQQTQQQIYEQPVQGAPNKFLRIKALPEDQLNIARQMSRNAQILTAKLEQLTETRDALRKGVAMMVSPYAERMIVNRDGKTGPQDTYVITELMGGERDDEYYRCRGRVLRKDGTLGDREIFLNFYDYTWHPKGTFDGEFNPIMNREERQAAKEATRRRKKKEEPAAPADVPVTVGVENAPVQQDLQQPPDVPQQCFQVQPQSQYPEGMVYTNTIPWDGVEQS